ncbi:MAG: Gfo/Idh/MocA family oxidoreductase [Planctomycetota bacterium]
MTEKKTTTRRSFLKQSSAAVIGSSVLAQAAALGAHARSQDTLRIALIGCGGRGAGAAAQALNTRDQGPIQLVAMADAFDNRLQGTLAHLQKQYPTQVDVPKDRQFIGFDAYEKAIASGVDVVVLATPPGFRPIHFAHAIDQGKHVFMEKPVAVDAPGVRQVLETAQKAKEKNLKVGVGLQRHHSAKYQETIQRIHDGALGDLILLRVYWNSAGVWVRGRETGETEMQYQMKNWYYFNWLCGDHITEQHIHNLDVGNWIKNGYPVSAQGQGGRQVRTGIDHGEIYDHHMVEFTYEDGTKMLSQCRHIPNCWNSVSEHAHGTKGTSNVGAGRLEIPGGESWRFRGEDPDAYQVEHDVLFAAIRNNRPHNEAENGAKSTMTSILGRMATYSGGVVQWDDAISSERSILPAKFAWDADPPTLPDQEGRYPIPMPGSTEVL